MPFGRWTLCPSLLEVVGVLLVFSRGEVCFGRQHRGDDTSYNASSEEEERFSSVSAIGQGWMEMEMVAWVVVDGVCVAWMVTVIVHTYS